MRVAPPWSAEAAATRERERLARAQHMTALRTQDVQPSEGQRAALQRVRLTKQKRSIMLERQAGQGQRPGMLGLQQAGQGSGSLAGRGGGSSNHPLDAASPTLLEHAACR